MNKEDLKAGEIYSCYHKNVSAVYKCIFLATANNNYVKRITYNINRFFPSSCFDYGLSDIQIATPEEKHWLNECIRLNRFITKELTMENFVKETYVKLTKDIYGYLNGDVAKVINKLGNGIIVFVPNRKSTSNHSPNVYYSLRNVKPSTKEEYDAQFVVKEPELQQPSKDASIEEILEYCKKKYPIGTKIKCTKHYTESPYNDNGILTEICYINKGSNIVWAKGQSYYVCIYHDGNYAEIIGETKQESPIKLAEQGHKLYSLEELTNALTKEYDKVDVQDILKVIKTIK